MLKNNKGFTLIELIAVVTIMAIIAIIATPNIITMIDNGKKEKYISDAKEFISKATYMYKLDKYRNDENIFIGNKIYLKNLNDINETEDPYGYIYDLENSFIEFSDVDNEEDGILERVVSIYLESCKYEKNDEGTEECNQEKKHYIKTSSNGPVPSNELTIDSVQ